MNDRYLYRAKWKNWRELPKEMWWVQGYLYGIWERRYILWGMINNVPDMVEVDPSTICQCTAMPDKNRKIAYEHDIIKTPVGNAKIIWICSPSPIDNHINVGFEVVFLDAIANDNYRHDLGYWIGKSEVIGNIFDNPELLEMGNDGE